MGFEQITPGENDSDFVVEIVDSTSSGATFSEYGRSVIHVARQLL
jgi:hypothetical protein